MTTQINDRLAAALDYLISDVIGQPRADRITSSAPAAHALQSLMHAAAVAGDVPEIHRLYADHGSVLKLPKAAGRCQPVSWGAASLTPSERFLLQFAFRDDIGLTARLVAPAAGAASQVQNSLALLERTLSAHLPLWWQELENLVSVIVLAEGEDATARFGGASAFAAWGAILVNPQSNGSPFPLALTLVHESSHLKLFHAYLDDEIVLNDPDERYSSPLRQEARPMNGLYHAAFVLARMVQFLSDLGASGPGLKDFGPEADEILAHYLARSITAFEAAHSVIEAHGNLTTKGRAILSEAAKAVTDRRRAQQAA